MPMGADPSKPPARFSASLTQQEYMRLYLESINSPEVFWRREAHRIHWYHPFKTVKNTSFIRGRVKINWYEEGQLNVCYNCIDRHLAEKADHVALHWEPDTPGEGRSFTYRQLHEQTCRLANGMISLGVTRGDTVAIFLPMIPEAVVCMLACARIGAVHCVIYAGTTSQQVADQIKRIDAKLVITAEQRHQGGITTVLKSVLEQALGEEATSVSHVIVVANAPAEELSPAIQGKPEIEYADLLASQSIHCQPVPVDAEDTLFILYTSGSTGKPKGVVHTSGGYLVYAASTHHYVFNFQQDDIFWCGADIGWITGHTYGVYGPLANATTSVMFEGVPGYPHGGRYGEIIDKYEVNKLYIVPAAIHQLMAAGNDSLGRSQRSSLQILATAGEPINPQAWHWLDQHFTSKHCQILDTWWQTESGGIVISPLPGATPLKPGSATRPFFGIRPALVNEAGRLLAGRAEGALVMLDSWPGQLRTLHNDHEQFESTYFGKFEGMYYTGDSARMDEDGYFWITGRTDDLLNLKGAHFGTAEIENCLINHPAIAEAAVVSISDQQRELGVYVFVTPIHHVNPNPELTRELINSINTSLGTLAPPATIQWTRGLPRTRSGKVIRRILRLIARDEEEKIKDLSALMNPGIVDDLIAQHKAL